MMMALVWSWILLEFFYKTINTSHMRVKNTLIKSCINYHLYNYDKY